MSCDLFVPAVWEKIKYNKVEEAWAADNEVRGQGGGGWGLKKRVELTYVYKEGRSASTMSVSPSVTPLSPSLPLSLPLSFLLYIRIYRISSNSSRTVY